MNIRCIAAILLCSCAEPSQEQARIYVGQARQTLIAVVADSDCANAYITDGRSDWVSYSTWFTPVANGTTPTFADGNMTMSVSLDELTGVLETASSSNTFTLELVEEPAGLYRAELTDEGVRYLGGWVFSPSGEQRGAVVTCSTDEVTSSLLSDPQQRTVTLANGVELSVYSILAPYCPEPENGSPGASGGNGGGGGGSGLCCATCSASSQACGDTCISLDKECHTPPGCACNA